MKTVADYPAMSVVDLQVDVLNIPPFYETKFGTKFCIQYKSARYGTMYSRVAPSCAAYYALENGENVDEVVERCKQRGDSLYWINSCASSLSNYHKPKEVWYLLKDGQKILMNGQLLKVVYVANKSCKLIPIDE